MTTGTLQSDSVTGAMNGDGSGFDSAWVNDAPLKLVAWALASLPDCTGRKKDILDVLATQVELSPSPDSWWKRVRPMLGKSDHFEEPKANQFNVLHEIEEIPPEPLPAAPRKVRTPKVKSPTKSESQWLNWFGGEVTTPPSRAPTKAAFQALDNYPVALIPQAMERASQTTLEFLASEKRSKQHAARWAELFSRLSSRWRDRPESYADVGNLAQPVGEIMGRLIEVANFPDGSGRWLRQAGGLPGEPPERWRVGFAVGLWQAFANSSPGARQCFQSCFGRSEQDKPAIAKELLLAAFTNGNSDLHYAGLDSLLGTLPAEARIELLQNLVVWSATGKASQDRVQDYVDSTDHIPAQSLGQELKLLVLAALLLTEGQSSIIDRVSQRIGDLLADRSVCVDDPALTGLLSAGRQHIADLCEQQATELERQRLCYEAKLEEHRHETVEQSEMVRGLRKQIAERREEARLDIRRDMLKEIGATLQSLRQCQDSPEQALRAVGSGLAAALRAGGAEELGTAGDIVPYEEKMHQAKGEIVQGTPVLVSVPGVIVRGELTGDHVLFRANVVYPAEVN